MDGARTMFFTKGISSLTMDQIAAHLRVSKKTLYKYFSNKDELVAASVEERMQEIGRKVTALLESSDLPFPQRLGGILNLVANQISQFGDSLFKDLSYREPQLWERIDQFRREHIYSAISAMLDEGMRAGFIRTDVDSRLVPLLFFNAVSAVLNPAQILTLSIPPAQLFDAFIRILFGGILTEEGRQQLFHEGVRE